MVFENEEMTLTTVREVMRGKVNDVFICQDISAELRPFYVLIVVKTRECAKKMLRVEANSNKANEGHCKACLSVFSSGDNLCFLYRYQARRRLSAFATGQLNTARKKEELAINLIMECLSTSFSYPFLYLILTQDNINILNDNKVFFTAQIDVAEINPEIGEAECAGVCAMLLMQMLMQDETRSLKSLELLQKKLIRESYESFPELYKDIRLTMLPTIKQAFFARVKALWRFNRKRIFNGIIICMAVVIVLAVLVFVGQLVFGDVVIFKLFENKFRIIGTERLDGV